MNIPRLSMTSTTAQLGIQRTPEVKDIENPKGFSLELRTTHPTLRVEGTLPRVQIDQYQSFADAGLKNALDLSKENSSYALGQLLQGMGTIAAQGTELTNIHTRVNVIAEQAIENAYDQFIRTFDIGTVPRSRPNIDLIRGELDIQVQEGSIENTSTVRRPVNNYRQGKVSLYMERYNNLTIEVINTQV